ncbi:Heparan-alpha-glucosaminide N-acetyltransferase [Spatholobus suberectus]|nr:Heparan-alpha-glucosaminide N-acetyltransferase [Spatholobus suberectus]
MDEEAKRMEEGLKSPLNDDGNKDELKKQETIKTSNGGSIIEHDKSVQPIAEQEQPLVKQKTKRVATLDAFRGLTIVLMILVDDAGGAYPRIDHSPWNGCTLADFVMPFFLFIVGVAIALALKRIPKIKDAVKKIILRTLKLLFWGIILQGGYSHAPDDLEYGVNMKFIRWCGILQRIALVYCVVALIETFTTKLRPTTLASGYLSIFTAYRWQWFGGFVAFLIYMITTFTLYVPDWSFVDHFNGDEPKRYTVICGMRGHLGPACNAVGHVDRQACTFSSPRDGPFRDDAPTILSGTIGIHYGHVLIHFKGHSERLKQWVSMGFVLLIIAIILHFTDAIPLNKQLYSFSYVCFTAGAAGIVFSGFYILIDVWGLRTPFLFLEWIGMNAMLVFVMAAEGIFAAFVNGWYYEDPRNSLVHWIKKHVFVNVWHSERVGTILYVIFAEITFWGVVAGVLHKFGIYWKL